MLSPSLAMKKDKENKQLSLSRRDFSRRLGLLLVGGLVAPLLSACEKERVFVRRPEHHPLGKITDLLAGKQHVRASAMLVIRDDNGWAALSTRCTFDGCDLSYQNKTLSCACCGSYFDHSGNTVYGPAKLPLPWYRVDFRNKLFYALGDHVVAQDERFSTAELEAQYQRLIAKYKTPNYSRIPKILLSHSNETTGIHDNTKLVMYPLKR